MHYSVAVMLPGDVPAEDVEDRFEAAMRPYNYDNEGCISDEWDWYSIGGRWGGSWVLREGGTDGPLETQSHSFGKRDRGAETGRTHTDCARLSELEFESLTSPYAWIDLAGAWHTKWLGPEGSGTKDVKHWEVDDVEWTERWMKLLATLPETTWMVQVDCHN